MIQTVTTNRKLTAKNKAAGILDIGFQNTNGSYQCKVLLGKIDTSSQATNFRTCDDRHAEEILSKFDIHSVRNPIIVLSKNGNKLFTLDGRHTIRVLVKQNKGGEMDGRFDVITCDVFFTMSIKQAAAVFNHLTQGNKRMDPWSAFYSALQAQFPFAVKLSDTWKEFGFTTPIDCGPPPQMGKNIKSLSAFVEAYDRSEQSDGSAVNSLCVLISAFQNQAEGTFQKQAGMCSFTRGLLDFLLKYEELYSPQRLREWLGDNSAEHYLNLANHRAGDSGTRLDRSHFKAAFETAIPHKFRK